MSCFRQALGFGRCFFPVKILIRKLLKTCFPASGMTTFFPYFFFPYVSANFISKSTEQLFLPDAGKISWFWWLFFPIKSLIEKGLNNWYFLLPASSWFWWLFFSCLNSNSKTIEDVFSSFWHDDIFFHNYFFPICKRKFYFKKCWTIVSSRFRQDLGFGGCFFPIKSLIEKVLKNWYFLLAASSWFWSLLFPV